MIYLDPRLIILLESGPILDLSGQGFLQMLPNFINVVVLAFIMGGLLYLPVKEALKARRDRIEAEINDAAEKSTSANALKKEYERKVKDVEIEKGTILEDARKQANERRTQLLEEAKLEAQELKDRAAKDIAVERDRIKDEVHRAIIDISSDIAAKLISATIDKNAHDRLFAEAMTELESTAFRPAE